MKPGDLYKQLVKSKLSLKGYYIGDVEKFQRGEIFDESDFAKYSQFEYEDYILYTGQVLKFKSSWDDNGNYVSNTDAIELPVFVHLRTFKLFIFRINFVFKNYFQLTACLDENDLVRIGEELDQ